MKPQARTQMRVVPLTVSATRFSRNFRENAFWDNIQNVLFSRKEQFAFFYQGHKNPIFVFSQSTF